MKLPLINNTRFAIYARLSREDLDDKKYSSSIENQVKTLKEKLAFQNLECVEIYIDDGYSGKNMNRPAIQQLINDIIHKKVNGVIVKDLSRIGRNMIEVGKFVEEFCNQHFIRVISVLDHYDSALHIDDESIVLKSFINDYYLKECREKQRQYFRRKRDKELLIKHGKYGYDVVDRKLVINEEEAEIIRWIFKQYTNGIPTSQIVRQLKENKVYGVGYLRNMKARTNLANDDPYFWDFKSINRIIHDNTYIGEYTNCANAIYTEAYTFTDVHEPIISKEIFEEAQRICESRKIIKNDDTYKFIYDGINNKYFVYSKEKKTPRGKYKDGRPRFKNHSAKLLSYRFNLNYEATIEIILNETKEVFEELKKNRNYILELILGSKSDIRPRIAKIKDELLNLENKKKSITARFISGYIDKTTYNTEKTSIEVKMKELKSELKDLEEKIKSDDITVYNNYVDEILLYEKVDMKLARLIFKRIVVTKDEAGNPIFDFEYNVM